MKSHHLVLLVVCCAAALVGVGTATGAAPTPKGQGACTASTQDQTRTVKFRWSYQQTLQKKGEKPGGGPWPVKPEGAPVTGDLGTMTLRATACKNPKTGWKLFKPVVLGFTSTGLTNKGEVRGDGMQRGWGIGLVDAREGATAYTQVRMMQCNKSNFFAGLKFIVGIPIPGIPFKAGVGKWGAGQLLPDDQRRCGNYGTVGVVFRAEADGGIVVEPSLASVESNVQEFATRHFVRRKTWTIIAPEIGY